MTSVVTAFLPLRGTSEALSRAFLGDPGAWLPEARREVDGWLLPVHAGAFSRTVLARIGEPWKVGTTRWRSLSWDPVHDDRVDRRLPSLDGELALHLVEGRATLVLEARYQPPGGAFGAAVDAVALHRVAKATVDRLLADIAEGLTTGIVDDGILQVPAVVSQPPPAAPSATS